MSLAQLVRNINLLSTKYLNDSDPDTLGELIEAFEVLKMDVDNDSSDSSSSSSSSSCSSSSSEDDLELRAGELTAGGPKHHKLVKRKNGTTYWRRTSAAIKRGIRHHKSPRR
jgi:hypothetical protein